MSKIPDIMKRKLWFFFPYRKYPKPIMLKRKDITIALIVSPMNTELELPTPSAEEVAGVGPVLDNSVVSFCMLSTRS